MTAHGHDNDPDFLADLAEIRDECMSGPYPEHLPRIFPRWKDGFQLSITKLIQDSATNNEAPVLLQPPPLGDTRPWLSVLFGLHLPAQESCWKSPQRLEKPSWMMGESLVLAQQLDYENEWQTVRAVCQVANEAEPYEAALVQLYALARCTFRLQPLRPFLHGVLIFRSTMEL